MTTPRFVRPPGGHAVDRLTIFAVVGFFCAVFVRAAWIADESFLDFRVVANALEGHGLRWNVVERVQTFTAPLWVLLLTGVTWVSGSIPLTALALNGLFAATTVWVVCVSAADLSVGSLAAVALALSPSFVNSSSAGLPDALAYVLAAAALVGCRFAPHRPTWALFAGLLPLASAPLTLLIAPVVAWTIAAAAPGARFKLILLLTAPGVLWGAFATFYYGLPFPMPFYSSWFQALEWQTSAEGLRRAVLWTSARADLVAVALIGGAVARGLWTRSSEELPTALGLLIYSGWVMLRGDPMDPRVLAPAALVSALMLAERQWFSESWRGLAATAGILLLGCFATAPTFLLFRPVVHDGAADSHRSSFERTALLRAYRYDPYPNLANFEPEIQYRIAQNSDVSVSRDLGVFSYAAGSRLVIVDPEGRLSPSALPNHAAVEPVAREPLWSVGRLRAVWRLNVRTLCGLFPPGRVSSQQSE